jgi:alpha/beta superfamily hydrolase
VIFHADRALHRAGWTTLRFNFRGVGESEGFHDDGRGEAADVGAAVDRLRVEAPDVPLLVVGYSFGSRMGLLWSLGDRSVSAMVAIGLPVRIWRFDEIPSFGRPLSVVQGSRDEFGPLEDVRRVLAAAEPPARLLVVEGAPHLFPGRAQEAADRVVEAAGEIVASL